MKRFIKLIFIILCLSITLFAFAACSDAGAPEHSVNDPRYAVTAERLETELDLFMEGRADRTSFTAAEERAAIYLQERLVNFGYTEAAIQDINVSEGDETDLQSRNVIAHYRTAASDSKTKNVLIGAYYDNRYSSAYKNATVYKSEGALANGTGVATLLVIADYLMTEKPQLDFDVTIVFFGAGYITDAGAEAYYNKGMTPDDRANTVLMIELQRLGVDHVYAFSDARTTKREPFFDKIAADNGLDVYKPTQKSPLITEATVFEGIPYYQWVHSGLFATFFNAKIPTLNLIGANWETIDFTNRESADNDNIAYTDRDSLKTLKELYPDYAEKMATAATLVIRSLESETFLSTMNYDRQNFPNTDVLTKNWIWYIVVVGVVIIFAAALMLVCSHLTKKYPIVAPKQKQLKMAVFGMDYEDKNSDNIFIDIRESKQDEDIFPGVPNNDKRKDSDIPFEDIFPSLFADLVDERKKSVDNSVKQEQKQENEEERTGQLVEPNIVNNDAESTIDKPADVESEKSAEKKAPAHKPTAAKPAAKRSTVSAGKSNAAQKSVKAGENKKSGSKKDEPRDGNKT